MNEISFEDIVQDALASLPDEFKNALRNIAIVIEDEPTDEQRKAAGTPPWAELFGLYQGVPLPHRRAGGPLLPDKITLFKYPILRSRRTVTKIQEQIRSTILHEIGHYFGLSEEELRAIQQK